MGDKCESSKNRCKPGYALIDDKTKKYPVKAPTKTIECGSGYSCQKDMCKPCASKSYESI